MPFDLQYKHQIEEIYKYLLNINDSVPIFIWNSSNNQKKNRLQNIIQSISSNENNTIFIDIFKNGIIKFKSLTNNVISDLTSDKCYIYNEIKITMNNYYINNNFFGDNTDKISIIIESIYNNSFINNNIKTGTCWFVLSTVNTKFNTLTPVLKANTMNMVCINDENNINNIKIHNDIYTIVLSCENENNTWLLNEIKLLSNNSEINNKYDAYNENSAVIIVMNLEIWNYIRSSMKNHFGNSNSSTPSNGIIFSFLLPNSNSINKNVYLAVYKNINKEIYKKDIDFSSNIDLVYSVKDLEKENTSFSVFFNNEAYNSVMSKLIQHKNNNPDRIEFLFKKNIGEYFNIISLTNNKNLKYVLEFSQEAEKISIYTIDNNNLYREKIKQTKSFIINRNK